jgi:hypothetical protein
MSKSQKKHNNYVYEDNDRPHHQVKKFKNAKEKKNYKNLENILKSKNIDRLLTLDDTY